jgi:hypothetical protein
MYLQRKNPQEALEILRLCETIIEKPENEVHQSDSVQQLFAH